MKIKLLAFLGALLATATALASNVPFDPKVDVFRVGKYPYSNDKVVEFNIGLGTSNPKLKWSVSGSALQFSNDGTTFLNVGSGSSATSVSDNFVGISSGWAPNNANDINADVSIGNWATYNDGAGSTPVDMTGGSALTTLTRTTTSGEVLNGGASFKVTKPTSNRQGDGGAVPVFIPLGYRGLPVTLSFPFKVTTGSIAVGDVKWYFYDVSNSTLLTPSTNLMSGSGSGVFSAKVTLLSSTAAIRAGYYIATNSASALTFEFDDVSISPPPPVKQVTGSSLTSTGSTTGYMFTVSSATASVGSTYTNNSNTYTVVSTIASGTQLFTSQASAPLSSGTLTKASGTGDSTITFSAAQALATYTTPAGTVALDVEMVGPGGQGGGGGSAAGSDGAGSTVFVSVSGALVLIANPGLGGGVNDGGFGGTASVSSGIVGRATQGASGQGAQYVFGNFAAGSAGSSSPFGGAGGSQRNAVGLDAGANTGSGGGGGGVNNAGPNWGGTGGGSGGYIKGVINNPEATYFYSIPNGGAGSGGGANGSAGGAGGSGAIYLFQR